MEFSYNDGGRKEAGYKGSAGDCGTRAIAIVTGLPYQEVYDLINEQCKKEYRSKKRSTRSSARTGIHTATYRKIMGILGWTWIPTMLVGQGMQVHMKAGELPRGKIICRLSKHYVAVVDGVIHDTHDCSRQGTRGVYGYWVK